MRLPKVKSTEDGLTLIESLAAIVIFGTAIVALSPPIALSIAARVRAHRAKQALELAQGEIDRVRLLVQRGDRDDQAKLPPGGSNPVGVPTSAIDCSNNTPTTPTTACLVDVNGDNIDDFVVQSFHTNQCNAGTAGNPIIVGFKMGVRVYTKSGFDSGGLVTKQASLAFSAATSASKAPLAVLEVPIVRSDLRESAQIYTNVLKGTACN